MIKPNFKGVFTQDQTNNIKLFQVIQTTDANGPRKVPKEPRLNFMAADGVQGRLAGVRAH